MYEFTIRTKDFSMDGIIPAESNYDVLQIVKQLVPDESQKVRVTVKKITVMKVSI